MARDEEWPRQAGKRTDRDQPRLTTLSCCIEFLCLFLFAPHSPHHTTLPPTPLDIYMSTLYVIDTLLHTAEVDEEEE